MKKFFKDIIELAAYAVLGFVCFIMVGLLWSFLMRFIVI